MKLGICSEVICDDDSSVREEEMSNAGVFCLVVR